MCTRTMSVHKTGAFFGILEEQKVSKTSIVVPFIGRHW